MEKKVLGVPFNYSSFTHSFLTHDKNFKVTFKIYFITVHIYNYFSGPSGLSTTEIGSVNATGH